MNKNWSDLNKTMQSQLCKAESFEQGKLTLFELRNELFDCLCQTCSKLSADDYSKIPFKNSKGNDCASIGWSLWHVFRIEDIVCHDLILKDKEVFFTAGFDKKTGSRIITTGNELSLDEMVDFARSLNIEHLFEYCRAVKASSEKMLSALEFADLKKTFDDDDKERLRSLKVVSEHEDAFWLIDYWCGKNIRGLIQMPFSRHWIMHVEAVLKIAQKIKG